MCLRYSSSVVAPTARSSPRASIGLSRLAASTAPSAAPAPTIVCSSSMKRITVPRASETSLRTAFSRSSNSPRYFAPAISAPMSSAITRRSLQRVGHVAGDDALGEALDDRRLAHARLADQHRVVLGAAREDLDHAADLVVATDDRVELALLGRLREVAAELLEGLVLVLGVLVGDAVRAANLVDRLEDLVARGAGVDLRVGGEREQDVLGRDVLVAEAARLLLGVLENLRARAVDRGGADLLAGDLRHRVELLVRAPAHTGHVHARVLEHGHNDPALLLEERGEDVKRGGLRVPARGGKPLSGRESLLGLGREAIDVHKKSKCGYSKFGLPRQLARTRGGALEQPGLG